MPRLVDNPYGRIFVLDMADGAAFLVTEVEDSRTGRTITTSVPLAAAELDKLARYLYYELALPASKREPEPVDVEDEEHEAERPALPAARYTGGSKRGRPKSVDYAEVARLYREGERLVKAGQLPDGIYAYIMEQQEIGETAAYNRVAKAWRQGLIKRRGRTTAHKTMAPPGSIDYAEVARLYMSEEAGAYGSRRRYLAEQLGITDSAAMNRAGKARKLGLIPPGWYADGYAGRQAPPEHEAGADRLRSLPREHEEPTEGEISANGSVDAPVEGPFPARGL